MWDPAIPFTQALKLSGMRLGMLTVGVNESSYFLFPTFYPLGKKAGFLGSAYFVGNFIGSLFWGWLSDTWGRRPVVLLGISGTVFAELLFGFSQTFTWAVMARFMWGLLNGNLAVGKSYVSEVL